jgi:hypothetical protein
MYRLPTRAFAKFNFTFLAERNDSHFRELLP